MNVDTDGFLKDIHSWNEAVALHLASQENITLDNAKWAAIHTLRNYYLSHQAMPRMREFMTLLRAQEGLEDLSSGQLHLWFPVSLTLQLARIAGLPKPKRCM